MAYPKAEGRQKASLRAPFSVPLASFAMTATWPGLVYEPFAGSGTSQFVARRANGPACRRGIEIEPKYVAVILERLAGMGLTPTLAA